MATTFHKTINNGEGALNASIDSDDTSIVLESGDGDNFPASGPFWITIDDEIIEITSRSTDTLTASTRGDQDTAATIHDEGAVVELLYTAEHLTEIQEAINALETSIGIDTEHVAFTNENTTFEHDLTVTEDLDVLGAIKIDGNPLTSTDLSDSSNLAYTNASETFTSDLGVGGNLTVTGTGSCASLNVGGGYGSTGASINGSGDISTNGILTVDGVATFSSTIEAPNIHNNGGTGSSGAVASGTYSPTLTAVNNVATSGSASGVWMRVGKVVTVGFRLSVTPSATTTTTDIGISLPIASNFTGNGDCGGVGINTGAPQSFGSVTPDTTNDRANMRFVSVNTSAHFFNGTFTYVIQ